MEGQVAKLAEHEERVQELEKERSFLRQELERERSAHQEHTTKWEEARSRARHVEAAATEAKERFAARGRRLAGEVARCMEGQAAKLAEHEERVQELEGERSFHKERVRQLEDRVRQLQVRPGPEESVEVLRAAQRSLAERTDELEASSVARARLEGRAQQLEAEMRTLGRELQQEQQRSVGSTAALAALPPAPLLPSQPASAAQQSVLLPFSPPVPSTMLAPPSPLSMLSLSSPQLPLVARPPAGPSPRVRELEATVATLKSQMAASRASRHGGSPGADSEGDHGWSSAAATTPFLSGAHGAASATAEAWTQTPSRVLAAHLPLPLAEVLAEVENEDRETLKGAAGGEGVDDPGNDESVGVGGGAILGSPGSDEAEQGSSSSSSSEAVPSPSGMRRRLLSPSAQLWMADVSPPSSSSSSSSPSFPSGTPCAASPGVEAADKGSLASATVDKALPVSPRGPALRREISRGGTGSGASASTSSDGSGNNSSSPEERRSEQSPRLLGQLFPHGSREASLMARVRQTRVSRYMIRQQGMSLPPVYESE